MATEPSFYFVIDQNGTAELDESVNFALRVYILKPEYFLTLSQKDLIIDIFLRGIGIIGLSILEYLSKQDDFKTLKIKDFSLNIQRLQIFCREMEYDFYYSIVLGFNLPDKMLFILDSMYLYSEVGITPYFLKPYFFYYGAVPLTCKVGPKIISSIADWDIDHCYYGLLFDFKNIEAQGIFKEAMDKVASSGPKNINDDYDPIYKKF